MHVGLLEDDLSIQEMLLLVLQDEGYTVTNYPDAEGCIEALKRAGEDGVPVPVDLMIVDWRLNGFMTGTEVIQQIRNNPHLTTLPIILTTAATFNDTTALAEFASLFIAETICGRRYDYPHQQLDAISLSKCVMPIMTLSLKIAGFTKLF